MARPRGSTVPGGYLTPGRAQRLEEKIAQLEGELEGVRAEIRDVRGLHFDLLRAQTGALINVLKEAANPGGNPNRNGG